MSLRALTIALATAALAPGILARPVAPTYGHSTERAGHAQFSKESRFNNPPPPAVATEDELYDSKVMSLPVAEPVNPGEHRKRDSPSAFEDDHIAQNEVEDEKVVDNSSIMMRPPANLPPFKPHSEKRDETSTNGDHEIYGTDAMMRPPADPLGSGRPGRRSVVESPPAGGHLPWGSSANGDASINVEDVILNPHAETKRFETPPIGGYIPHDVLENDDAALDVNEIVTKRFVETPPMGGYIPHEEGTQSVNVGDLPLSPTDPSLEPGLPAGKRDTPPAMGGHVPQFTDSKHNLGDGKTMMLPPADHHGPGTNH